MFALYEYVITFDREVQSIWQRQFSFATVLWVFVRQLEIVFISIINGVLTLESIYVTPILLSNHPWCVANLISQCTVIPDIA